LKEPINLSKCKIELINHDPEVMKERRINQSGEAMKRT